MKRIIAAVLVGFMGSTTVMAAGGHGHHPMAGCGLGYLVFQDNNSTGPQILAATTNNLIIPQTSAITSGTSGCTEKGLMAQSRQAEVFAEVNLKELSREMSVGQGEYLSAFISLLNVSDSQKGIAMTTIRDNYASVFPSANVSSVEMTNNLVGTLKAHGITLG